MTPPLLEDIDGDGHLDVFVPAPGGLARLDLEGREVWHYPLPTIAWAERANAHGRLRARDLDGDGATELVATSNEGLVVVLDAATGAQKWRYDIGKDRRGGGSGGRGRRRQIRGARGVRGPAHLLPEINRTRTSCWWGCALGEMRRR